MTLKTELSAHGVSASGNVEADGLAIAENAAITQRLDLDQQDELMKLRAQQAQVLKSRFEAHVVVMFTDVVGSTAYYEKYGDFMGRQKMLAHNALLFPIVTAHGGSVVKTIGDAIMAVFTEADLALGAAAVMQRTLQDFNTTSPSVDEEIHIRIGLNAGSAIAEGTDLHGDVINVASRLVAQADADEILIAPALAAEVTRWSLKPLGPVSVKGKREPLKLFRLQWREQVTDRAEAPLALMAPSGLSPAYSLRSIIGRGPLGTVYLAENTRTQKRVAVKVLHPHVATSPAARHRAHEQLLAQSRFEHAGAVRVLEYAAPPVGDVFFVTEYIDGIDLSELVARHGIPPLHEIAFIAYRLAEVLALAHAQGIVHGDLKPENVLLDKNGHVSLRDFGLSQTWTNLLTESATPLGNPAYMAPELLTGAIPDPRSDVYSLGALLYFLASGRAPVEGGATMQTLTAIAAGEIAPLSQVRPQVAPELVAIVDKAMAVHQGRRFSSPTLLMPRLKQLVGGDADRASETLTHYVDDTTARRALPGVAALANDTQSGAAGVGRTTDPMIVSGDAPTTDRLRLGVIQHASRSAGLYAAFGILLILAALLAALLFIRGSGNDRRSTTPTAFSGGRQLPGVVASAIVLVTEPGAEVFLDDKLVGRTPGVRSLAVQPGQHGLKIIHPDFEVYDEKVRVAAGETVRLKIALKRR